jgi:hypothetical protein
MGQQIIADICGGKTGTEVQILRRGDLEGENGRAESLNLSVEPAQVNGTYHSELGGMGVKSRAR